MQSRSYLIGENQRLKKQLLQQQFELQKLEHLKAENIRLNELLNASSIVDERVVQAQLTGESPDPFTKRVLINKGSVHDVYVGQPVIDAFGLMGQIVDVEPYASWVLLITDPQHSTPDSDQPQWQPGNCFRYPGQPAKAGIEQYFRYL